MVLTRAILRVMCLITASFSVLPANASVQIGTTRVIYHSTDKDVSVQVNNPGNYPVLLQSWVDEGNPEIKPENIRSPFVLTPPLTRVNAGAGQTLRLSFIGAGLPTDRESLYWLNVLEIPPVAQQESNKIQVAFRSRIKILYRPEALDDKGALRAAAQLRWHQQGAKITLTNPTPYFISALAIVFQHNGKKTTVPATMIAPNSSETFSLSPGITLSPSAPLSVDTINDYGAVTSQLIQQ